ncbi:thioredoxin family protein [Bacillus sp. MUM 13]|uniref:thioredoxin family protein n=1 Tax=Bacillus sp. MUM 13 TaxID=1678001 RepID=UPI0008F5DEA1|nr:thioredoxin family protein [Bacillus sp. MUM 13]OIK12121.1 thiol reductase thioredoxin [Bacillus sp. MUM 13]
MKKFAIFLLVVLALFITISLISSMQRNERSEGNPYGKKSLKPATIGQLKDPNYQNLILPDELSKKLKDHENTVVYFYSPDCKECIKTTPVVAPLAEKMGIDLVQYNLLEFQSGREKYHIKSAPAVIYFKNGVEQDRITGYNGEKAYMEWFQKNKIE